VLFRSAHGQNFGFLKMNVAVIETKWDGHHPTYFREYVLTLAGLGCRVYAFCPKPDDELLRSLFEGPLAERISVERWAPSRVQLRPRRFNPRINWWLAFNWLKRRLRGIESEMGEKFDFLFFACLYDGDLRYFPRKMPWQWGGLYIHVRAFRKPGTPVPYSTLIPAPERWFRRSDVAGIAVLDEGSVKFMRDKTGCANVVPFPDFTDEAAPVFDGVAAELRAFARGRPIVGIAGHLHPTKGVIVLAQVAEQMKSEDVVFAFVGELMTGLFNDEDQELLRRIASLPNVYARFERIPGGGSFNGVVGQFDVFFAAYVDFPHSSNMLAKAALFRRPVIVSEGYLMSDRVREFGLGAITSEGDFDGVARVIRDLLANRARVPSGKYQQYLDLHSTQRLRVAFKEFISHISHQ
jgi:hypothetical protein